MSIQNPLVVDFGVQAADGEHPVHVNFNVQTEGASIPFHVSSEIRPVIQADTYIHVQNQASDCWFIEHKLKKYPSVTIVDTAGTVVVGDVLYVDNNNIICTFTHPFSGTAYLN